MKFVDEQAVFEAFNSGTKYPLLYHGKLDDVFIIKIYQDEILYARIKPMWSDDMQYIPISNVRFVEDAAEKEPEPPEPNIDDLSY